MQTSLTSEAESTLVCACKQWMRKACYGEPSYNTPKGQRFCVLHLPESDKSADFQEALTRKIDNGDFNFRGAWFPDEVMFQDDFKAEADFQHAVFNKDVSFSGVTFCAEVNFNHATFEGEASFYSVLFDAAGFFGGTLFSTFANFRSANFKDLANFNSADFKGRVTFFRAVFMKGAIFDGANFSAVAEFTEAIFSTDAYLSTVNFRAKANFDEVSFGSNTNFIASTFAETADFTLATFAREADFSSARFLDQATFEGKFLFGIGSSLNLRFARIEKPGGVSFHTTTLRPHWFVNVDARKLNFTNVHWGWRGLNVMFAKEIESLRKVSADSPYRMFGIACRQLAVNAEENDRLEDASNFRYLAMDAQRREQWGGWAFWKLSFWYWVASGFGERVLKAFLILVGIWLLASLFYSRVGFTRWEPKVTNEIDLVIAKRDDIGSPLNFGRALTYSASVMMLQKPEPRPLTTAAQTIVLLETILGPVQAALLALAIRRKFMR